MESFFNKASNEWTDCGTYYISNAEQRSPSWHKTRSGRVTASNFGTCVGHSRFSTPDELALEISGFKTKEFLDNSKRIMDYGTKIEPEARSWYEKCRNVKVREYGLAVPKWNIYIGGSPDGVIDNSDGIIEIKCPEKMYGPLKERMIKYNSGQMITNDDNCILSFVLSRVHTFFRGI